MGKLTFIWLTLDYYLFNPASHPVSSPESRLGRRVKLRCSVWIAPRGRLLLLRRRQEVLNGREHDLCGAVARIVGELDDNRLGAVLRNRSVQVLNRTFSLAALIKADETDALREAWRRERIKLV